MNTGKRLDDRNCLIKCVTLKDKLESQAQKVPGRAYSAKFPVSRGTVYFYFQSKTNGYY
jgi:hypothetical protein